jgi:hypothetical protein
MNSMNPIQPIIGRVTTDCHPTDVQVKKLRLAAKGDIKRFMDRLDWLARKYDNALGELEELEAISLEAAKAKITLNAGLFGEDSLFFKTLVTTGLQYPVAVARAVDSFQGALRLKERQRTELLDLLLRETRPPRKFGKSSDIALVLFQASRIPIEKIRRVLDESQSREMFRWIDTYQQGAGSEAVLRRNGFVFDDEPVLTQRVEADHATKESKPRGNPAR